MLGFESLVQKARVEHEKMPEMAETDLIDIVERKTAAKSRKVESLFNVAVGCGGASQPCRHRVSHSLSF